MKKITSFADLVFVTGDEEINTPKEESSLEGNSTTKENASMLPLFDEVSSSHQTKETILEADFKVVDRREKKVASKKGFTTTHEEGGKKSVKPWIKKNHGGFNTSPKNIRYPNNEYANRNNMIILKKEDNCWSFTIGKDTPLKTSLKFPCFKGKDGEDQIKYYCQERTWRFAKLIPVNGMDVLIPERGYSVTFLDIDNIGESELLSVEPADDFTEVILGPEYESTEGGTHSVGRVVSHNGPIFARFRVKGKSIEDYEKEIIVEIALDGISKVIK